MAGSGDVALRLDSLQALSVDLAEALHPREVARVMVRRATPAFGGLSGSLCVVLPDGETFELVEEIGYAPEIDQRWKRFPLSAPLPAGDAIRRKAPIALQSVAARDDAYPIFAGTPTASKSFVVLPLLIGERPLGVFTIGFQDEREFGDADIAFLNALAALCAQSLHRAQLLEAAEDAAERLQYLADATAALSSSLDRNETLVALLDLVVPNLADGCALVVVDDDGPTVVVRHVDEDMSASLHKLAESDPAGFSAATHIEAVTDTAVAERLSGEGQLGVAAAIPLVAASRTLGGLALLNQAGRELVEDDFTLAQELAARAAGAVENARLFHLQSSVASTLWQALLPPSLPPIRGVDLAARYQPIGDGVEIGGDFYDVVGLGGSRWLLVIGDVCGKGTVAARHTALVRHAIRTAAVVTPEPAAILRLANDAVLQYHDDIDPDDDTTLCTACVMSIEHGSDGVVGCVASAGHPAPIVYSSAREPTDVGDAGPLLGVFTEVEFPETRVDLKVGDVLVLHTDGITDRHRAGSFFGREGLVGALPPPATPAHRIADALVDAARDFILGGPYDDMAVVVCRVDPDAGKGAA